ncbi:hypothetical protein Q8A73_010743 [Channa argus]|nr:hypothetical protein Q8A73_010743 [Channa argus]
MVKNPVSNSTDVSANEGDDITLQCVTNPPNVNLTFEWKHNNALIPDQNKSELVLEGVLSDDAGSYSCVGNSTCCVFESGPCSVKITNQSVILLVVCGVAALLLIVIMGLAMKFKLKRDNDKHRERRKQRGQGGQNGGPAPFTPRES